jgi:tagatose-6-phosphate ketose/aldose isomerase
MSAVFSEFDAEARVNLGATHTMPEILGQPALWRAIWARLRGERHRLGPFLASPALGPEREIVLTGAGSSAYIGELLQGCCALRTGRSVRAVPTTDIVTNPEEAFPRDVPTLLISFARSGNSPESAAAMASADARLGDVRHLIITCNPEGDLARHPSVHPREVFVLPPEADDQGLAMTGSFTGMALAGLLLQDLDGLEAAEARVERLAAAAEAMLGGQGELFRNLASLDFTRAIFLGAGALKAAARESHLKLQELSDGQVICAYDSFLGFRHGPKAAINESTIIVFLFSGRAGHRSYEEDLVHELRNGARGMFHLGVGEGLRAPSAMEATIPLPAAMPDEERAICAVLAAQILGVHKAIALGLRPDQPSPSGSIARVVRGVRIYTNPPPERPLR